MLTSLMSALRIANVSISNADISIKLFYVSPSGGVMDYLSALVEMFKYNWKYSILGKEVFKKKTLKISIWHDLFTV